MKKSLRTRLLEFVKSQEHLIDMMKILSLLIHKYTSLILFLLLISGKRLAPMHARCPIFAVLMLSTIFWLPDRILLFQDRSLCHQRELKPSLFPMFRYLNLDLLSASFFVIIHFYWTQRKTLVLISYLQR